MLKTTIYWKHASCLDCITKFVTTWSSLVHPQEQVAKVLGVDHNRIVVRTKRMGEFMRDV